MVPGRRARENGRVSRGPRPGQTRPGLSRAAGGGPPPPGSSPSPEAKLDLWPQAGAGLTGGGDLSHAASALDAAWKHLVRRDTGLVLLFDPPFDTMEPTPGYIRGYPPGGRENGGPCNPARTRR